MSPYAGWDIGVIAFEYSKPIQGQERLSYGITYGVGESLEATRVNKARNNQ